MNPRVKLVVGVLMLTWTLVPSLTGDLLEAAAMVVAASNVARRVTLLVNALKLVKTVAVVDEGLEVVAAVELASVAVKKGTLLATARSLVRMMVADRHSRSDREEMTTAAASVEEATTSQPGSLQVVVTMLAGTTTVSQTGTTLEEAAAGVTTAVVEASTHDHLRTRRRLTEAVGVPKTKHHKAVVAAEAGEPTTRSLQCTH